MPHPSQYRGSGPGPRPRSAPCLIATALLFACTVSARAQSDTGRTPGPVAPDSRAAVWAFSAGAGVLTSGDLFEVTVVSGNPQQWSTPEGTRFNSHEFLVTLDEGLQVAGSLAYRLQGRWWLRGDVSWSEVDATALVKTGDLVEVIPYDRITFLMAGLALESRLVESTSYPYLLGGFGLVKVDAARAGELDQNRTGLRLGIGFHQEFDQGWGLRLEIRDTVQQLDSRRHDPRPLAGDGVGVRFEELGPQHLFEVGAGIQGIF